VISTSLNRELKFSNFASPVSQLISVIENDSLRSSLRIAELGYAGDQDSHVSLPTCSRGRDRVEKSAPQ